MMGVPAKKESGGSRGIFPVLPVHGDEVSGADGIEFLPDRDLAISAGWGGFFGTAGGGPF